MVKKSVFDFLTFDKRAISLEILIRSGSNKAQPKENLKIFKACFRVLDGLAVYGSKNTLYFRQFLLNKTGRFLSPKPLNNNKISIFRDIAVF